MSLSNSITMSSTTSITSSSRPWLDTLPPPPAKISLSASKSTPLTSQQQLHIGDRVQVNSMNGIVRFIGPTKFKEGTWAGIELDNIGLGKNDGSVDGKRYFVCPPNAGLFLLAIKVIKQQHHLLLHNRPSTPHNKTMKPSKSSIITTSRTATAPLPPLPPIPTAQNNELLLLKKKIERLESENRILRDQQDTKSTKIHLLEQTISDIKKASMDSMEILESMVTTQSERASQFEHLLNIERQKNNQLIFENDDLQKAGLEVIEELEKTNELLATEKREKQHMLKSHHENVKLLLQDMNVLELVLQHKMDKSTELNDALKKELFLNIKLTTELKGLKKQERYSTYYMRDRLDTPIEEEPEEEEEDLLDDNILSVCALCEKKGHDLVHCNIIVSDQKQQHQQQQHHQPVR